MSADTKHDVENVQKSVWWGIRIILFINRHVIKPTGRWISKQIKRYKFRHMDPIKAIKQDGINDDLVKSPQLTEGELKDGIAFCMENDILAVAYEVDEHGEPLSRGMSLKEQEDLAKDEIKLKKWESRAEKYRKVGIVSHLCNRKAEEIKDKIALQEAQRKAEGNNTQRFRIKCNAKHQKTFNDWLETVARKRIAEARGENSENVIVDEKAKEDFTAQPDKIEVEEIKAGREYGIDREITKENVFKQIVSKELFCEKYSDICENLPCSAKEYDDNNMMLWYRKRYCDEARKIFGDEEHRIVEYGANSGETLDQKKNGEDAIGTIRITETQEMEKFRSEYDGKDYIAIHNPDGSISVSVAMGTAKEVAKNVASKNVQAHEQEKSSKDLEQGDKENKGTESWAKNENMKNDGESLNLEDGEMEK